MIITEEVRNYKYNKINSVENFVNLCMESYVATTDNKYISILIDDHKLFEAYDAEWNKAESVGDQTTDTNDTKSDTNKEINMLRAMLRTAINKSKEYIKEKIHWLKEWYKKHFSEEHMAKMKEKAKGLWNKVKEKFHYVMKKLIEKLDSSDEEEDFEFTESTDIIISVDNEIDSCALTESLVRYDSDLFSIPEDKDKDKKYGLYAYHGTSYGTKSNGSDKMDHYYVSVDGNENDLKINATTGWFSKETTKKIAEKVTKIDKEYEKVNHPKSWISKKIAWLRGLYNKLMVRIDKINHKCKTDLQDPKKKSAFLELKQWLSNIASTVMHLIDRMANKLQLMLDKD